MTVVLYPHQSKAVDQLSSGKILWGGVGSGKSITAAVYYMQKEAPKDVYVITTAKKRDELDWEGEFAKLGVGKATNATLGGVLTVDSWNNIGKYRGVKDAFFIFDEQRLVGAGQWSSVFLKISESNSWLLLTATPGDTWLDYIPVFIANGFYKNRTEFKREHVVYNNYSKFPKVERYTSVGRLVKQRNQLLVEMPYLKHTTRHIVHVQTSYNAEQFYEVTHRRWNPFEGRPIRDVAEMFGLMRKVVNTDPSRLDAVRDLMKKHPRLIVFYSFDYELEILRTLTDSSRSSESVSQTDAPTADDPGPNGRSQEASPHSESVAEFAMAEWNGHKHEPLPDTERWVYLVQYVAGAEGWNCTSTDATCFYSLHYSFKVTEQAKGRIDRLNTKFLDLWYYFLTTNSMIDRAIQSALEKKEDFNEKKYAAKVV